MVPRVILVGTMWFKHTTGLHLNTHLDLGACPGTPWSPSWAGYLENDTQMMIWASDVDTHLGCILLFFDGMLEQAS